MNQPPAQSDEQTSGNPQTPSSDASRDWAAFRNQMPVARRYAYFDHAAVAPLPQPTVDAITQWLDAASSEGDVKWLHWERRVEQLRSVAAAMINAEETEIALVSNTTTGIGHVAEGFPWKPGDNVVMPSGEFPSNIFPWKHLESRGVELRTVDFPDERIDLNRLAAACDANTRIMTVSWIGYASGFRIDPAQAAQAAHDAGALLFLDAIQGLGVFPLDVKAADIDFLAADGHKWMLGPEGAGIFYVKQKHLDLLRPMCVGWNSVEQRYNFASADLTFRNEAARYEGGSQNMIGMHALARSLELLTEYGIGPDDSPIGRRILEVTDMLIERLEAIGAKICSDRTRQHRSGIVSFEFPGHNPDEIRTHLMANGVVLSVRHDRLRIAAHAYNNEEDIRRLTELIEGFIS